MCPCPYFGAAFQADLTPAVHLGSGDILGPSAPPATGAPEEVEGGGGQDVLGGALNFLSFGCKGAILMVHRS